MLGRAGFDTEPHRDHIARWLDSLVQDGVLRTSDDFLLFSPFQEMLPSFTTSLFASRGRVAGTLRDGALPNVVTAPYGRAGAIRTTVRMLSAKPAESRRVTAGNIGEAIRSEVRSSKGGTDDVIELFMRRYENASRAVFYPLVADLFTCLGFRCSTSRPGVNYQRYDALIDDPSESVPIEIKSPTEELYISVKAIRQALENKVIILARAQAKTRRSTTSLVVGFYLPNERAEVSELIADIKTAFRMNIGVVDFRSLLALAIGVLTGGKTYDRDAMLNLRGLIDVVDS